MMRQYGTFLLAVIVVALLVVVFSGTFIVTQTEQALLLRFGEPVAGRGLVTQPGLHFKVPLIEHVIDIDKRILNLETPNQEVLASDNTRIQVDAFLRYRIVDPLEFYQDGADHAAGRQPARLHHELGHPPRAWRGGPDADRARRPRQADGRDPRPGEHRDAAPSASRRSTSASAAPTCRDRFPNRSSPG